VKLDKLAKQARRELLANPKKAAVLGLMLLVAAYFWGPLVWKWIAPNGATKGGKDATALILTDDPVEATPQTKPGAPKPFRWQKVRELIRSDRLMIPATLEAEWPNPFAPLAVAASAQPAAGAGQPGTGELPAQSAAELTPQTAGLTLSSVAIGPKRRTATISGETYREGQIVTASGQGTPADESLGFRIVRIETRGVELERSGQTWWLLFDKPKLARGDEIETFGRHDPK
jgi:hypothetical protein